jgi:SAM-dependent methyltransferase
MSDDRHSEQEAVRLRYDRRSTSVEPERYNPVHPDVWQSMQERQREMLRLFARLGMTDLGRISLAEVGCGTGKNLLEFLRLGFQPQHLIGIELLEDRVAAANRVLPMGVVRGGDAVQAALPAESLDVVFQSVVFSSLLDADFQQALADAMWRWVKPGGGVLWYDFVYDNPRNPDVRGVPVRRVRALFPAGAVQTARLTLAPPLARALCRVHPALYTVANVFPSLRTHVLCWIQKDRKSPIAP